MKKLLAAALAAVAITASAPASAALIDFNDINTAGGLTPPLSTYAGLDWVNAFAFGPGGPPALQGLQVSGNGVTGGGGVFITFASANFFTFNSAFFATRAQGGETFTIVGYANSNASGGGIFTQNIALTATPTLFTFNWANVRSVRVTANGNNWAMDNLTINATAPVPEPATWAMMMLGFGAIGFATRRRTQVRVRYA